MTLAGIERDKALSSWRAARGDDMVKWQARYNSMQDIIDFINKAPVQIGQQ